MKRDDRARRIADIRAAVEDIERIVLARTDDELDALETTDRLMWRALKNAFAELGEAVKALPPADLASHPAVPWRALAGQRDIVVHAYFAVEMSLLRRTVIDDFPPLKTALDALSR